MLALILIFIGLAVGPFTTYFGLHQGGFEDLHDLDAVFTTCIGILFSARAITSFLFLL